MFTLSRLSAQSRLKIINHGLANCPVTTKVARVKLVGVIGSGIMGSGIAEVIAKSGIDVVIRSRSQETADATKTAIENSLKKQVAKSKITQDQQDEIGRAHV